MTKPITDLEGRLDASFKRSEKALKPHVHSFEYRNKEDGYVCECGKVAINHD